MGFIDWLTRPALASPWRDGDNLETLTIAHLLDPSTDDLPMSRSLAMSIPAAARARHMLTTTIARCMILAHAADGRLDQQPTILLQPDPGTPRFITILWTVDELLWHGRAFWQGLEAGPDGRITRARAVPQSLIDFDLDGLPIGYQGTPWPKERWIRIDGPHEGVLNHGARALRAALAIEQAVRRASDMPVPLVELHQTTPTPKLTSKERQDLIAGWVAARKSPTGAVGFSTSNIEVKTHGVPAEQLLIGGRQAAALDIARIMGLPAWTVDATTSGSSITYQNLTDRNRELVDFGCGPYISAIEARLSLDDILPAGIWARFDTSDLTRGDLKQRAEAAKAAQDAGLQTPDESRAAERGAPQEA